MPLVVPRQLLQAERKRRVHAKSRKGCGNCKLRHVKCDELRPQCKKCLLYGVDCTYGGSEKTLQLSAQGSFQVDFAPQALTEVIDSGAVAPPSFDILQSNQTMLGSSMLSSSSTQAMMRASSNVYDCSGSNRTVGFDTPPGHLLNLCSPISMVSTMATMIDESLHVSGADMRPPPERDWSPPTAHWHFSEAHLEILARFRDRTALTIGQKSLAPAYRDILCKLAMTNTFLMHMLLSITLMHDAHLTSSSPTLKHTSLQHWNTATKLFNNLLALPILPHHRDAIWATGVIIGAASFWYIHSTSVNEVWPLKPSEPDDLGWMKLGEGKRALWNIADPTRLDSVFYEILKHKKAFGHTRPEWIRRPEAIGLIPGCVKEKFDITPSSTIENNIYLLPLLLLSRIQNMRLTHDNVIHFLYVIAFISPQFITLLENKDERAVFVIGWWFKIMGDGELWWMVQRAIVEGRAIRVWLGREDGEHGLAGVLDGLVRGEGDRECGDLPVEVWSECGYGGRCWVEGS